MWLEKLERVLKFMLFGEEGEGPRLGFKLLKHSFKCLLDVNTSKLHRNLSGKVLYSPLRK